MTKTIKQAMTNKWLLVIQEYELVKQKKSKNFKKIKEICKAFKVHRKDIRKYYERWIKLGKDIEALLPQKRGPKPGILKILSKAEERTIIAIHCRLQANEFEIYHLIKDNPHFKVHPSVSTIGRLGEKNLSFSSPTRASAKREEEDLSSSPTRASAKREEEDLSSSLT